MINGPVQMIPGARSRQEDDGLLFDAVSYRFRSPRRGGDALTELDLRCAPSSITCMVGPNGAGKSTALALAAGLIGTSRGRIRFSGTPVTPTRPPAALGYLPQASAFPAPLTVAEVLDFALSVRGTSPSDRDAVLEVTGLEAALGKRAGALSSGWSRRLGLAVALAPPTDLLLLDEPFVGLDLETLDRVVEYLEARRRDGATVLMASHDYETVDRLAPRVVVLSEGRVLGEVAAGQLGSREGYRRIAAGTAAPRDQAAAVGAGRHGRRHHADP